MTSSATTPTKLTPAQQFVRTTHRDWVIAQAYRLKVFESFDAGEGDENLVIAWLEKLGYPTTTSEIAKAFTWLLDNDLSAWEGPYIVTSVEGDRHLQHTLVIRHDRVYINGTAVDNVSYNHGTLIFEGARAPADRDDTVYRGHFTFAFGEHATLDAAITSDEIRKTCSGRLWSGTTEPTTDNAQGSTPRVALRAAGTLASAGTGVLVPWDMITFFGRYTASASGAAHGPGDFFVDTDFLKYGVVFARKPFTALQNAENHLKWDTDTPGVVAEANVRGDIGFSADGEWKTIAGSITLDGSDPPSANNFFATAVPPEWNKSTETIVGTSAAAIIVGLLGIVAGYYFYRNAPAAAAAYEAKVAKDEAPEDVHVVTKWERAMGEMRQWAGAFTESVVSLFERAQPTQDVPLDMEEIEEVIERTKGEVDEIVRKSKLAAREAGDALKRTNDLKIVEKNKAEAAKAAIQHALAHPEDEKAQSAADAAIRETDNAKKDREEAERDQATKEAAALEWSDKEFEATGRGRI